MATLRLALKLGLCAALGALIVQMFACASLSTPIEKSIRGTLIKVERDERYEAPCPILGRLQDPAACDKPPVCCAYHATVQDSTGKKTRFWFFAPKHNLIPREGWMATWRLHRNQIWIPSTCTVYGCQYDVDYQLESLDDVLPISHP